MKESHNTTYSYEHEHEAPQKRNLSDMKGGGGGSVTDKGIACGKKCRQKSIAAWSIAIEEKTPPSAQIITNNATT